MCWVSWGLKCVGYGGAYKETDAAYFKAIFLQSSEEDVNVENLPHQTVRRRQALCKLGNSY
jgi:hypothetical protein